jgi:ferredoxin
MNVTIDPDKCTLCEQCVTKCAGGAFIPWMMQPTEFKSENWIDCMACTEPDFCPNNAVEVKET